MSPHCVWIITVGGKVDKLTPVKFPNIVMLTELGKNVNFLSISVHNVSAREIFKKVFMWV